MKTFAASSHTHEVKQKTWRSLQHTHTEETEDMKTKAPSLSHTHTLSLSLSLTKTHTHTHTHTWNKWKRGHEDLCSTLHSHSLFFKAETASHLYSPLKSPYPMITASYTADQCAGIKLFGTIGCTKTTTTTTTSTTTTEDTGISACTNVSSCDLKSLHRN